MRIKRLVIVTPNAEKIYKSIISNLDSAIHSYTIIGLWYRQVFFFNCFDASLSGAQKHFKTKTTQRDLSLI